MQLGVRACLFAVSASFAACGGPTGVDPLLRGGDSASNGDSTTGNVDGDETQHDLDAPELTHTSGGKSWTVLVYMVADNDLEPFALYDLEEMMAVGGSSSFKIVVQIDRAQGYVADPIGGIANFTSSKRLRVEAGRLVELDDLGEQNMGDPEVLADFIGWGINTFPADNIAIVFWDHGSAWPGFGADLSSGYDGLTLAELASAMTDGLAMTDRDRVAMVGFDACLMGSLETALVMRDYAEYLLGSEELEPGHGWDYRAFDDARRKPTIGPVDLAQAVVDGFREQSVEAGTDQNITLGLLDLYTLKAIERALVDLSAAFASDIDGLAAPFGRARSSALEFGRQATAQDSALMVDLTGVADAIADDDNSASRSAEALATAVRDSVLMHTAGEATAKAVGLSVYWPPYRTLYDDDYDKVPAIAVWRDLLQSIQDATSSAPGAPAFVSPTANAVMQGGWLEVTGNLVTGTETNVVSEGMYYGLVVDGHYYVLGDVFGQLSGRTVVGDWDGTALVVRQSTKSDYVYFSYQLGENGTTVATIPFGYAASSGAQLQTVLMVIVYNSAGTVTQQTMYLSSAAGYGELTPAAGSKIYPVYAELVDGRFEWGATATAFDPTVTFNLTLEAVSTSASNREAFAILFVEDYSGASATATWTGEL